jgi:hypothetical protein
VSVVTQLGKNGGKAGDCGFEGAGHGHSGMPGSQVWADGLAPPKAQDGFRRWMRSEVYNFSTFNVGRGASVWLGGGPWNPDRIACADRAAAG